MKLSNLPAAAGELIAGCQVWEQFGMVLPPRQAVMLAQHQAAALPDTLYTDGPAAELEIASMPYLTVKKRQGSVAADSTTPDTSANVTLTLFGTLPVKTVRAVSTERRMSVSR